MTLVFTPREVQLALLGQRCVLVDAASASTLSVFSRQFPLLLQVIDADTLLIIPGATVGDRFAFHHLRSRNRRVVLFLADAEATTSEQQIAPGASRQRIGLASRADVVSFLCNCVVDGVARNGELCENKPLPERSFSFDQTGTRLPPPPAIMRAVPRDVEPEVSTYRRVDAQACINTAYVSPFGERCEDYVGGRLLFEMRNMSAEELGF